jgi:hypothetical protein
MYCGRDRGEQREGRREGWIVEAKEELQEVGWG